MYKYALVQVPRDLSVKMGKSEGAAAEYLQEVIDKYASVGWEFYRIDNLTVTEKPGCFGFLTGQKEIYHSVDVVCFRRKKDDEELES